VEAIKIVRFELHKQVIVLNPHQNSPSYELNRIATFVKPIRKGVLAASQFPTTMQDEHGQFSKPPTW